MPWLPATAYLHSVMIQEKRGMLKTWNLLLIGITYILCLFGTFLTRSGVVQSVHAFAQTPVFVSVFLGYVLVSAIVYLVVLLARRNQIRSPNRLESMVSREASFLLNNWVLMAIMLVVFWGTMLPVFSELFTGKRLTVGPKFFNTLAGPLALFLIFLTGVGPLIAWRRASASILRRQFAWPSLVGVLTALGLAALLRDQLDFYGLMAWSLGAFVMATIAQEYGRAIRARVRKGEENVFQACATLLRKNQQRYGGYIVHLGVVLVLMGAAGSVLNEERLENVQPGNEIRMDGYRLRYLTAEALPAQHYGGARARLSLYHHDEPVGVMTPEKRMYWLQQQPASIPSVHSTLREDFYVILTALEADGSATVKIYRNPLVNWIWIGGWVFMLGTVVIMWPHPQRRSEPPAA
jgi:cytochrome c-type biogenesis protein CcmF